MSLSISKKTFMTAFVVALIMLLSFYLFVSAGFAAPNTGGSFLDKINNFGDGIVDFLKDCLKIIITIVLATMGYSLLVSKSAEGLADMKVRVITLIICIILVNGGEPIYNWLSGLM